MLKAGQLSYQELSEAEKEVVGTMPYFFEKIVVDGQEIVSPNAFAQFIFEDYINTTIKVSTEVKELINKNEQYKNFIHNQLMELIKKVKLYFKNYREYQGLKGELQHNETWGINKPYIYKGVSNGSKFVFRCAYDFDSINSVLSIYKIWLKHDEYEDDCEKIAKGKKMIDR